MDEDQAGMGNTQHKMSMFCEKGVYFVLWNMACSFWLQNTVEVSIPWAPNYEIISASIDKNVGAKFDSNMVHCKLTKTDLGEPLGIRWVSSHLS
jgi:hypothetical protein